MARYLWSDTTTPDGSRLVIEVELATGPRLLVRPDGKGDYHSYTFPPPATGQNPDFDHLGVAIGNPLPIDEVVAEVTGPGTWEARIYLPNGNIWRTVTQTAADGVVTYPTGGQMKDCADLAMMSRRRV